MDWGRQREARFSANSVAPIASENHFHDLQRAYIDSELAFRPYPQLS